jgi:hypothetical protein
MRTQIDGQRLLQAASRPQLLAVPHRYHDHHQRLFHGSIAPPTPLSHIKIRDPRAQRNPCAPLMGGALELPTVC